MTDEELQAMIDEFDMDQDGASMCIFVADDVFSFLFRAILVDLWRRSHLNGMPLLDFIPFCICASLLFDP
jgi:hypothetical protein